MTKANYITIRELFEGTYDKSLADGYEVAIDGWVINNRFMGKVGFLTFNDGTCFKNAQLVYSEQTPGFEEIEKLRLGASISIQGSVHLTPDAPQPVEIILNSVKVVGGVDESYPLQKKKTSLEFLRTIPHLRPRTNTFRAVYRVRSVLSMAVHEFFQGEGFVYVHTPLISIFRKCYS